MKESLAQNDYGQLNDPENQTQSKTQGSLIVKVVVGILLLAGVIALIVHFAAGSNDDSAKVDALVPVNHLYAKVALNDNAPLTIGDHHVCLWTIVPYQSLDEIEVVDENGRNLKPEAGSQETQDPADWATNTNWHVHDEPELMVRGEICEDPGSEVVLIVEPNVEVRGEITTNGVMYRIDTVDKDNSRIVVVADADQNDGMPWSQPSQDMLDAEEEWKKMNVNVTIPDDPDSYQRRNLQNNHIIWVEYVVGFDAANKWTPSGATQYIRELNAYVQRVYYRSLGFDLRVRRVTVRTSFLVRNANGCSPILTQVRSRHRKPRDAHLVHWVSSQNCGGGVAYLGGLYSTVPFAVSGGLKRDFGRWDTMVVAHEFGHNFGAQHTHDLNPPVDRCGRGCANGRREVGTVMSYCHICGGWNFMREDWHSRTRAAIGAYYNNNRRRIA